MRPSQKIFGKDTLIHFEEHVGDSHKDKQKGHPGRENTIATQWLTDMKSFYENFYYSSSCKRIMTWKFSWKLIV